MKVASCTALSQQSKFSVSTRTSAFRTAVPFSRVPVKLPGRARAPCPLLTTASAPIGAEQLKQAEHQIETVTFMRHDEPISILPAQPPAAKQKKPWWHHFAGIGVALALAVALALSAVGPAEAARSGGRMGGSSFSSSASRSYSGSSSGTSSRYSSSGLSSGYSPYRSYTAPSIVSGTAYSSFFFPVSPWGYGGGYVTPVSGGGGSGIVTFLFLAVFAFVAFNTLQSFVGGGSDGLTMGGERVAVAKLNVGLLGSARHLQRELERIAKRADTSSPDGLQYVLQETVLALLRNPEYCVYGAANVKSKSSPEEAEESFNRLSMQERGKFQQETLVNVGGRTRSSQLSKRPPEDGDSELIVITILVAAEGQLKLPKVTNQEELRTALNRLGAVRTDQLMAVEVIWTPQDEDDHYTRSEMFMDYPELNTL